MKKGFVRFLKVEKAMCVRGCNHVPCQERSRPGLQLEEHESGEKLLRVSDIMAEGSSLG